jgi:hypothetical protein
VEIPPRRNTLFLLGGIFVFNKAHILLINMAGGSYND